VSGLAIVGAQRNGATVGLRCEDGVIEALELDGAPVLGVQWELQEEWRIDARFQRVFDWFVAAAGASSCGRLTAAR